MAKAITFVFAVYGNRGYERVEVITDTLKDAIEKVETFSDTKPLRIELIHEAPTRYELLGTE
jgi:hypothetical protein